MADQASTKLLEETKTFPGHGSTILRVFDTRSKKSSVVSAKTQSQNLLLVLDSSNEEDITSQFKVKRASPEFARIVIDRLKLVFKDGKLQLELDWTGIRRIQIEAAARAEKVAERKRQEEENRVLREKQKEEARLAEEERKRQEEVERQRKIEEARKAEEERLRREEEERNREANEKKKLFEGTISEALLNGGVARPKPKRVEADGDGNEDDKIVKTWSEEQRSFYYYNTETNELTWRHPDIQSVWEKKWDHQQSVFYFVNTQTGEKLWDEPYSNQVEKLWVEERERWYYVHRETGDVYEEEPYY